MTPFGSAIGGGEALKAAMQRRGVDVGILNQISPTAPTAPTSAPPPPVPQSAPSALPPTTTPQLPAQTVGGILPSSGEAMILVKALDSRLKTLSKIDEAKTLSQTSY